MDSNSLSHIKWNCKYHIVFALKFRRKIIYGKLRQDIANILSALYKRKSVKIVEAEMCPDHVYVSWNSVKYKCIKFCEILERKKYVNDIWNINLETDISGVEVYYVDTVEKNAKKIQEYIQNQLKEDLENDLMTLKEYIDPFTGESVNANH